MLASALALGLIAAIATGGELKRLGSIRLQLWPVLLLAVALRVVAALTFSGWAFAISLFAIVLVCVANIRLPGLALVGAGTTLNLIVVVANVGMPVSQSALENANATLPQDGVHIAMSSATTLNWLGDILPVSVVRGVYSLGDVISAVGAFALPVIQSRR
jgi:uncharacterized protein DUF5317